MAKKARKKSAAKRRKTSKTKKVKVRAAKRAKRTKPARRANKRKAKPHSFGERVSNAYHAVVDTVKGTDQLRNKLEKPGTSESE